MALIITIIISYCVPSTLSHRSLWTLLAGHHWSTVLFPLFLTFQTHHRVSR